MADLGIKATIAGKSITSTIPEDYLIWSKYYNLKALDTDPAWPTTATILANGSHVDYTIPHNLNYNPLYNLFFLDLNGRIIRIPGKSLETSGVRGRVLSETVNSITVRLGHPTYTVGTNRVYSVFHFIYIDPNVI